jgi:uncharacterized membrane protein YqjE
MKLIEPNGLIDNLYKYVNTNIELAKLEVQERIEEGIKRVLLIGAMAIVALLFLLFFFITFALVLNHLLGASPYVGFLVVTLLLGGILGVAAVFGQKKLRQNSQKELVDDKD